jgi:hypothetical protein
MPVVHPKTKEIPLCGFHSIFNICQIFANLLASLLTLILNPNCIFLPNNIFKEKMKEGGKIKVVFSSSSQASQSL